MGGQGPAVERLVTSCARTAQVYSEVTWSAAMPTVPDPPITASADRLGGAPVFAGTRVPVQSLIDYLEAGHPLDQSRNTVPVLAPLAPVILDALLTMTPGDFRVIGV